jgi:uncharacterized membrane protein
MKDIAGFIKTTLIGGALVILPLALVAILLQKAIGAAHKALQPLAAHLPGGTVLPDLIAIGLVVFVCFLAGLLIRTTLGRRFRDLLERRLYDRVPGYKLLKAVGGGSFSDKEGRAIQPAFAEIGGGLVPAFIMERHADGRTTVFVPSCPTPAVGSLYVLPAGKVHPVDVPLSKFTSCISAWGLGAKELMPASAVAGLAS